jgi:endoglucanase Acf2
MKRPLILASALILLLGVIAAGIFLFNKQQKQNEVSLIQADTLAGLKKFSDTTIDTSRLADGVIPPTNTWFSGIALQKVPQTVFPTPLSFTPSDTGFSYGLNGVQTSENGIVATHREDVRFVIQGAESYKITRYDEISVTMTYYNAGNQKILAVTIASGVPYIFMQRFNDEVKLTVNQPYVTKDSIPTYKADNAVYAAAGTSLNNNELTLDERSTLYAADTQKEADTLAPLALNQIESFGVSYEKKGDNYETTLITKTSNNQPTVLGFLPHQKSPQQNSMFDTQTLYGKQSFAKGTRFTFSSPTITADTSLKLDSISKAERDELVTMLRRDVNATKFTGIDTYYSGKELYRSAQLLQLASQLGETQIADSMSQKLRAEFETWFAPAGSRTQKLFTYDEKLHTVIGLQASFGSNDSNDHHFHYGYFIYAASILAKYDPEFNETTAPKIDLLVADIANYKDGEQLPLRRSFDPYFGHSWASGSSPFNDGNNQESSSEAINAWIGTSEWAAVRKNQTLAKQSEWMLSQEVASTQEYWLNDAKDVGDGGYKHEIVPLNWGGKRDYSTFFSAEPGAKLGILLIPLSPTMQKDSVLLRDRIQPQLTEAPAIQTDVYNFEDYLLMYKSLINTDDALDAVNNLPASKIDSANSRSYMYAWVLSSR